MILLVRWDDVRDYDLVSGSFWDLLQVVTFHTNMTKVQVPSCIMQEEAKPSSTVLVPVLVLYLTSTVDVQVLLLKRGRPSNTFLVGRI